MARKPQISVWLDQDLLQRIDNERSTAEAALPGSRMSRSAWALQRLRDHFAKKDERASKKAS